MMKAESATDILSSVPTCLSSSGVYWAAALDAAGDDFIVGLCGLLANAAPATVGEVVAAACDCTVLFCLLAEYLSFLRLDLPGISALFS